MLIIINATEHDDLSGDYIDLYNYHILECRSNKFGRFILPGYLPEIIFGLDTYIEMHLLQ